MRAPRLVPALLVAGSLACEPNAPTGVAPQDTPRFSIANAPDASGIIVRDDVPFAVTWIDPKAGTLVVIGADIFEFCGGTINFDIVPFQDAILPDGRIVEVVQGSDMRTSVWPFATFDCDLFTTVTPLATGMSDLVYTDNDLLGSVVNNANAWGFLAQGSLTRPNGAAAAFSAHARFRFNLTSGFKVVSSVITLK